jgi:NADPH:quinone reductase-like Zn-dependent oxidoreductase
MRLVRLTAPGGLENLRLVDEGHPDPGPGQVLVRIRVSSLNFHDDMVVLGKIPSADGRIPMTDGRGVDHVIEVGGPGTLMQSIAACRTGGHIAALIGVLTVDRQFPLQDIVPAFRYLESQKHFGKVCLGL